MFSRKLKNMVVIVLSVLMSNLPQVALATNVELASQMISTQAVLNDLTRTESEQNLNEFLQTREAKDQMMIYGLSTEEASARLASLSDQELRDLSKQIHESRAGGDVLVTIILILLIVFLFQRI